MPPVACKRDRILPIWIMQWMSYKRPELDSPPVFNGAALLIILVLCVVFFVLFVFVQCLVCQMLPVFLDYLFFTAPSVFSNVYLIYNS